MAKGDTRLEEPVMNQVRTVAGKQNSSVQAVPTPARTADVPEPQTSLSNQTLPLDAPVAPSVQHPNVLAAGANSAASYPQGTTTSATLKKSQEDNTAPPVNPAPNHPQAQKAERVYTQEEVNALLEQQAAGRQPVASANYALEEPQRADQAYVVVKPNRTIAPYIGDRTWYLTKDQAVRVPQAVAVELGRAGVIYPVYNF